jgi:hypothetical protein
MSSCAENRLALKSGAEAADVKLIRRLCVVRERSWLAEGRPVRTAGRPGSANAGISSVKRSENLLRRKPKVSWGRVVRPGLGGTLVEVERRR